MAAAASSSSSSVDWRRSAASALLRAIAKSHVETWDRPWNFSRLTPNIQEHFASEVLSSRLVRDDAQEKAIDAHIVPYEQTLHRMLVAGGNGLH